MTARQLQLPDAVLQQTFADLEVCLPAEGVGLWSGKGRDVLTWTPLANVSPAPRTSYRVHPQEWLDALQRCSVRGEQPLAIVHSHPTAPAVPSARDRAEWYYPDLLCVVVAFVNNQPVWQEYKM